MIFKNVNRLKKAFMESIDIGDRWHSYEVTDWDEVAKRLPLFLAIKSEKFGIVSLYG